LHEADPDFARAELSRQTLRNAIDADFDSAFTASPGAGTRSPKKLPMEMIRQPLPR
jgi:hypothetical protein